MRDEDEKRRFMEQQLRDTERSQFKRLQSAGGLQPADAPPAPVPRQKDRPPTRQAVLLSTGTPDAAATLTAHLYAGRSSAL